MESIKASQEARRERKESVAYLSRVRELVDGAAAEDEDLSRRYRSRTPEARFRTQQQKHREGMAFLADSADQFTLHSGWVKPALHLDRDMGEWDRARQRRRRNRQAQEQQLHQQKNMGDGHSGNSDSQHGTENDRLEAILQLEEDMERNRRIDEYIWSHRQQQPRNNFQTNEPPDESRFEESIDLGPRSKKMKTSHSQLSQEVNGNKTVDGRETN